MKGKRRRNKSPLKKDEYKLSKYTKAKRISKNTAYKKGRQLEYRVMKHFQKLGYYCRRNYASKGAEDVNCMKSIEMQTIDQNKIEVIQGTASEVLHIQCKNLKVEKPLSKREADNLKALAKITGGTPLLAQNINHKLTITEVE